ncbi:hypothetical protein TNCV_2271561 [Trichonephila clavipes]|nr:hypothetical protein TNCV_2271561 [Trichonephila clavipes]
MVLPWFLHKPAGVRHTCSNGQTPSAHCRCFTTIVYVRRQSAASGSDLVHSSMAKLLGTQVSSNNYNRERRDWDVRRMSTDERKNRNWRNPEVVDRPNDRRGSYRSTYGMELRKPDEPWI